MNEPVMPNLSLPAMHALLVWIGEIEPGDKVIMEECHE
jgi:hypothetical protein